MFCIFDFSIPKATTKTLENGSAVKSVVRTTHLAPWPYTHIVFSKTQWMTRGAVRSLKKVSTLHVQLVSETFLFVSQIANWAVLNTILQVFISQLNIHFNQLSQTQWFIKFKQRKHDHESWKQIMDLLAEQAQLYSL